MKKPRVKPMKSSYDGSVFGYRCVECDGFWKIYHTNESHGSDCSHAGKTGYADRN